MIVASVGDCNESFVSMNSLTCLIAWHGSCDLGQSVSDSRILFEGSLMTPFSSRLPKGTRLPHGVITVHPRMEDRCPISALRIHFDHRGLPNL